MMKRIILWLMGKAVKSFVLFLVQRFLRKWLGRR